MLIGKNCEIKINYPEEEKNESRHDRYNAVVYFPVAPVSASSTCFSPLRAKIYRIRSLSVLTELGIKTVDVPGVFAFIIPGSVIITLIFSRFI